MKSKPLFPNQTVTQTGLPPSQELVEVVQRIVGDILSNETALAALRAEFGGSVALGSDVTNSTTTMADVTGLSFPVTAGQRYWFRFTIDFTSAATTTGATFTINGPAATRISYRVTLDAGSFATLGALGVSAYNTPAAGVASSASTGANIALIEGFVTPSADGTITARFASEVAASAIVAKAGSTVHWRQV